VGIKETLHKGVTEMARVMSHSLAELLGDCDVDFATDNRL